ncbi:MAG: serpin family protein [Ilumatobacteraceae bacterium]
MSMQRRTFLSLLTLPAIAVALPACGDDSKGTGTTPAGTDPIDTDPISTDPVSTDPTGTDQGGTGAHASLRGTAAHVTADADPTAASLAINAFAADLFDRLVAADPTANLIVSPASIALALAMTSAGAKGTTLAEMDAVLHITDPTTIHRSMNGLGAVLAAQNQRQDNTAEGGTGVSEVQLSIANSLWAQAGLEFEQAFLDLLSAEYDAGLEIVDYASNPEAARTAINEWVAAETKDRIPELLGEGTITAASRLTLVNAIYLKANWATAFNEALTTDDPFTTPTGEVTVAMMHTDGTFQVAATDDWKAIDLPYVFYGLTMTVLVPNTAPAGAGAPLPTGDEVFAALAPQPVMLSFPRFDIETSTSLADVLGAMGMTTAFTDAADFSGMTTDEPLTIGDVIHQANITVDETGTEAAAATAVVMVATAMPDPTEPIQFVVDHPFTFWLRDLYSGTIVFVGRINDPSLTRG